MPDTSPHAQRYLESRHDARLLAEREFADRHPALIKLLASGNEYLAGCVLRLSGKDLRQAPHGLYACDLVISFTRTHFIAIDLLGQGELIEAAVLVRKQIELLARLHELSANESLARLVGNTPNARSLTTELRKLYSSYSEITHSADPIHLQQLGRISKGGGTWTPTYPKYSSNAAIAIQHMLLSLAEFHSWAGPYLSQILSEDEFADFEGDFATFAEEYVRFYSPGAQREGSGALLQPVAPRDDEPPTFAAP